MKKNVLVTGAAGFIASHVVDQLINMGYNVIGLDDLSGGFKENINPESEFIMGSINDDTLVKRIFKDYNFEFVFHLAAYAAEGLSHFIKKYNYENNLIGSINLINASVNYNVRCFVFTSSIAVYGPNQVPMTETTVPRPEDPYGIAKYAIEMDLQEAKEMFDLNYIIFRPHNVYGERQNIGDKYRNVLGIFMNQLLQEKPLTIFGDGEQTRAFSYIDDVAPIIAKSVTRPESYNEIFNIGADIPYSVNLLAKVIANAMNVSYQINYLEARKEVVHAFSNHDKVKAIFSDLIQCVSLEEGVSKMVKWVKKQGAKQSLKFENIEVYKNLPPSWQ